MSIKSKVLALLEQNRGAAVSGKRIAGQLAVSRSAVWKAVEELRQDGYRISAVTNRGYCLEAGNDLLSPEGIRPYLAQPLQQAEIIVFQTIDTTNNAAKRMAMDGASHGTMVLAEQQTGGKGRRGRAFFSPPGTGLYLSVILKPKRGIEQSLLVTSAAAVATARALKICGGVEAQIKWVNDLYLNGKKICGILAEAVTNLEDGAIDYVVVGIGVNLSTPSGGFPPELQDRVASVFEETGVRIPRNRLAAQILTELLFLAGQPDGGAFLEEYRARSCVLGKRVSLSGPMGEDRGTAVDITQEGHLVVKLDNGETTTLRSGEITLRTED